MIVPIQTLHLAFITLFMHTLQLILAKSNSENASNDNFELSRQKSIVPVAMATGDYTVILQCINTLAMDKHTLPIATGAILVKTCALGRYSI